MRHIPQSLHDAFPADAEVMSRMKRDDTHFQQLASQFGDLDDEIAALEASGDFTDAMLEELKKRRLALLDAIAAQLAAAKVA